MFFSILYNDLDFERPPWDSISPLAKDFVKSLLQVRRAVWVRAQSRSAATALIAHLGSWQPCPTSATRCQISRSEGLSSVALGPRQRNPCGALHHAPSQPLGAHVPFLPAPQRDVSARPTAAEALQHPWLAQADAAVASAVAASAGPEAQQGQGQAAVSPRPLSDSLVQRLQRYGTYGRLKQLALR